MTKGLKKLFIYSAGHTYSNLSRLFLRLFTGVMFMQVGIRQILHFNELVPSFDGFMGLSPEASVTMLVVLELLCATCIMIGLMTRFAVIPPLVMMCCAEHALLSAEAGAEQFFSFQPGYPLMFIGIFVYMLLAGPGKISLDYIIAIHMLDDQDQEDTDTLEKA